MTAAEDRLAEIDAAAGDITAVPLGREEEIRLRNLEAVVEAGIESFIAVGNSLAAIRDGRLYRATHSTFEAYCKDRWGLGDRHARNIINAAEVGTMVPVANERQARELVGLEPDQAVEVYQRTIAETAGRPTAKAIREVRRKVTPPKGKLISCGGKKRRFRLDPDRVIEKTALDASTIVSETMLRLVEFTELDGDRLAGWISDLDDGIRQLQGLRDRLHREHLARTSTLDFGESS